jgi:uncharacterized GH25 family protein
MTYRSLSWAVGALLLAPGWLHAHEIKVLASNPTPAPSGKTTIYLGWGHRLPVDDLVEAATIDRYEIIAPDGKATPLKKDGLSLQANVFSFAGEGVHQAVVVRKPSVHTYVVDADGTKQLKRGPKSQYARMKIDSSMRSAQFGKAIIQVGKAGNDATKALGHDLEIVPHAPAANWKTNAATQFRVLFQGKPLPQAKVTMHFVSSRPESENQEPATADGEGAVLLRLTEPGIWMIRAQHRQDAPASLRDQFDTDSYTATLTLFVRP